MGDALDKAELFCKKGWVPVKWKHHPELVREIIRKEHFRPKLKSCFENCGRFAIAAKRQGHSRKFEYCEGWVEAEGSPIPIAHAWLIYKKEILDLTLEPGREVKYGEHRVMTISQAVEEILERKAFGPLVDLYKFGPHVEAHEALQKLREFQAKGASEQ